MTAVVTGLSTFDVRFPTSSTLDGSDAMNPDPDYSASYVVLHTDAGERLEGHGFAFTIGRGNEVVVAAIRALERLVVGQPVDDLAADPGGFARRLTNDSQLRWLGPEKGVVAMATAAVVNAAWDLIARLAGKPVWRLLSDMSPEQIVDLIDFRYIEDALTRAEALDILRDVEPGRAERIDHLFEHGYPAYTTTPGWLGYDDERMMRLAAQAVSDGFGQIKLKVGARPADDLRRLRLARETVGPDVRIAIDANQRWGVTEAIDAVRALAEFEPWWIEEPTNPDDILGHATIRRGVRPIKVATGEHTANRVVFKQLLQAQAIDIVQIDACRVAGVNENVAILLLAAKHGMPVCPHAGGVGLCETVQHLSMFDYVAVSASMTDRAIEFVDHLHEHFVDPVQLARGRYLAPTAPGMSSRLLPESIDAYGYPDGEFWRGEMKVAQA